MQFTDTVTEILKQLGIAAWSMTECRTESAELFFVKKQLDTRRTKDTVKYCVTVYRDGEKDGKALRGSTDTEILSSDSPERIREKLSDAYFAAQFAMNPYYDLPDPVREPARQKAGPLAEAPLAVSAGKMTEALFAPDTRADSFINSAEIFIERTAVHILTSAGTDVAYTDAAAKGEFVVQCRAPEDVEMFYEFSYDALCTEALGKMVAEALRNVADRARAQKVLRTGKYSLILCGEEAATVLSYYAERSNASMIFSGYSSWKAGDAIQGAEINGEALDLTLCATVPYSPEGIVMKDLPLLRGGALKNIYGSTRFCRYLGIAPTGNYEKFRCENAGTLSFEEMKKTPCLVAVAFSDFQMDSFSGHFGGEIRLAYLVDGDTVIPVTGGSVNGSILDTQKDLVFSTDRFENASYEGPYALLLRDVSVAGSN